MQRLIILILALAASWLPSVASAWWQPDWQYRKQISIDTTPEGGAIGETVGRTPLLVRLHTGNFAFDGTNENGSDLRFVTGDDQIVLNHQVESFDPLMGMALVWVDIPEVLGGARQDIWMYYGNEKAPVASNGQITFDPNYTLVYHFDGALGAPARDSTAYTNHAQTPPADALLQASRQEQPAYLETLRDLFNPKRYVPATVQYMDIPGMKKGESAESLDLDPLRHWPAPETAVPVDLRTGPVVITVEYVIREDDQLEFLTAMSERRRIRRRDGALNWRLLRDLSPPSREGEPVGESVG